jgi:hypothetical protein
MIMPVSALSKIEIRRGKNLSRIIAPGFEPEFYFSCGQLNTGGGTEGF